MAAQVAGAQDSPARLGMRRTHSSPSNTPGSVSSTGTNSTPGRRPRMVPGTVRQRGSGGDVLAGLRRVSAAAPVPPPRRSGSAGDTPHGAAGSSSSSKAAVTATGGQGAGGGAGATAAGDDSLASRLAGRITGVGSDTPATAAAAKATASGTTGTAAATNKAAATPSSGSAAAAGGASGGAPSTKAAKAATGAGGAAGADAAPAAPVSMFDDEGFSASKLARFDKAINSPNVDLVALKKLCWNGIPRKFRAKAWKLLLGYLPTNAARQAGVVARKRAEYMTLKERHYGKNRVYRTEKDDKTLRDVLVDLPRTCPGMALVHTDFVQRSLERVLYIWALRHPASGYVQGINDIVTPLYLVFMLQLVDVDKGDLSGVEESALMEVECDIYWCLTKLLDGIQDHYTFSQPGIQRMVFKLKELVQRIDAKLHAHLEKQGLTDFMQLFFRWMNCQLLRDLPHKLVIRLWDTLMSEEEGFEGFVVYVSAAIVCRFSKTMQGLAFQELMFFIQRGLPKETAKWTVSDIEEVISQAYINKTLYDKAPKHLQ